MARGNGANGAVARSCTGTVARAAATTTLILFSSATIFGRPFAVRIGVTVTAARSTMAAETCAVLNVHATFGHVMNIATGIDVATARYRQTIHAVRVLVVVLDACMLIVVIRMLFGVRRCRMMR